MIYKLPYILVAILILSCTSLFGADSNTVSSTVVTDKSVPTASAPSIVINNNDKLNYLIHKDLIQDHKSLLPYNLKNKNHSKDHF